MNHPFARDGDRHIGGHSSILVDHRAVDLAVLPLVLDVVPECDHFTGSSVNFGMSCDIMGQLAIKVIVSDRFNIKLVL